MKKQINRLARLGLGAALAVVPALVGSQTTWAGGQTTAGTTYQAIAPRTCAPGESINNGCIPPITAASGQVTQASQQPVQAVDGAAQIYNEIDTGTQAQTTLNGQADATGKINSQNQDYSQRMLEKENQAASDQLAGWNSSNRNYNVNQKLDASLLEDRSNGDSCAASAALGMACSKTDQQIKNFQTMNQVSQAVGASAVGITGQISNQNAAQSGSQSEMIKAQGKIQEFGAGIQVTTGLMNTAFGVVQMQSASERDKNAKALEIAKSKANEVKINTDGDASANFKYRESGYYNNVDYAGQAGSIKKDQINNSIVGKIVEDGILSNGKAATTSNGGLEALGSGLSTSITPGEASALSKHFPEGNPSPEQVMARSSQLQEKVNLAYAAQCNVPAKPPSCLTPSTWLADPANSEYRTASNEAIALKRASTVVGARNKSILTRQASLQNQVKSTAQAASAEQSNEADKARQSGIISLVQGVAQMAQGALSYEAAKVAEKAALNYNTGNTQPAFQVTSGVAQTLSPTNPGTTALQPGTGGDTPPPTNPGNITANSIPNLGTPVNPDATGGGAGGGPAPNSFAGGVPAAGAGSGGGSGITVGATQPDRSSGEVDNSPRAAPAGPPANYNSSGQGYVAGSGGVGAEKGQDLSFLANLLPKKEDEPSKNGILDFGKNRSPASMAPYSLLGRDVNLFKRISDTMSEKAKSGSVGI